MVRPSNEGHARPLTDAESVSIGDGTDVGEDGIDFDNGGGSEPGGGAGTVTPPESRVVKFIYDSSAWDGVLDFAQANVWDITLTANQSAPTFANPPSAGLLGRMEVTYRQPASGGPFTLAHPTLVEWRDTDGTSGGSAPTMPTADDSQLTVVYDTRDGGSTYGGSYDSAGGSGTTIAVQEDGTPVVAAADTLNAGHGLDVTDETGGVAGLAVDEGELEITDIGAAETDTSKRLAPDGSGGVEWAAGGLTNPMTTQDDIIVGGASGTPARLAKGTDGQVLTVDPSTHHLVWATPSAGSGDVATDTIWDAKGDLAVGTGSDTAARLAKGTDGHVLTADSGETTGLKWAAPSGGGGGGVNLGLPTGSLDHGYTFDSTVESWTTTAGTLSSSSSKLHLTHTGAAVALEPVGATAIGDGEYQFDYYLPASIGGASSMGIIFRATDASNYYLWIVGAGSTASIRLFKCVSGSFTALRDTNTILPVGEGRHFFRVMVRMDGPLLSLYLNGTLVSQVYDTTYTTGRCGIRIDNTSLDIDNVKAYDGIDYGS